MYASVFLHTVNCMIGSGILAIPYAASLVGNAFFTVSACVVSLWAFVSLAVLFDCTQQYYGNMEDLAHKAYGRPGYILMVALLVFENVGSICSYLFVILYMCKSVVVHFEPEFILAVIVLFVLFPISIPKSINGLSVFSFLAVAIVMGFIGYVLTYLCIFGVADSAKQPVVLSYIDVPKCMSILTFAFVCHPTAITLAEYGSNRRKTLTSFAVAFVICTVIYAIFGVCGFLSFGTLTPDNIIRAYSNAKYGIGGTYILPAVIAISVILTVPALLIPLKKMMTKLDYSYNQWMSTLLTYIAIYFIVIFVPALENIITVVGASAASTIMFVISPLLYLKLVNGKSCIGWIMLVIGVLFTIMCVIAVLYHLIVPLQL